MRPIEDDNAIWTLREAVPEFEGCMAELRDIYGEDLTAAVVFTNLAEYLEWLFDEDEDPELIERCLSAVEEVVVAGEVDVVEVVGYGFLDALRPDVLEQAVEYFGPATERIAELGFDGWELAEEQLSDADLADIEDLFGPGVLTNRPSPREARSS